MPLPPATPTGKISSSAGAGKHTPPTAEAPEESHLFVGAWVERGGGEPARLYPKLQLTLKAPAVGTHGVLQGERYSVRLTYGQKTSIYDLIDASQAPVAIG